MIIHGFVPYKPLAAGALTRADRAHDEAVTPHRAAIAYLFDKSPHMLPVPGTSDAMHLDAITRARADLPWLPEPVAA